MRPPGETRYLRTLSSTGALLLFGQTLFAQLAGCWLALATLISAGGPIRAIVAPVPRIIEMPSSIGHYPFLKLLKTGSYRRLAATRTPVSCHSCTFGDVASNVCFGSRLCKNVCCYFCAARLWVWMMCRDGFTDFAGFRGWWGLIGRLTPL